MFGYITANMATMDKEQQTRYRAYYCGLCRVLREKGYDLPADLYQPAELKEYLLRLWKEAQTC